MKKGIVVLGIMICASGLLGCGSSMEAVTTEGASFEIPTSWTRVDSWHDRAYYACDYYFDTHIYDYLEYEETAEEKLDKEVESIYGSDYRDSKVVQNDVKVDGQSGKAYSYYSFYNDGSEESHLEGNIGFHIDVYVIYKDQLYRFLFSSIKEVEDESDDIEKETFSTMKKILKTVRFEEVVETPVQQ